jgi:Tfp pilus assembly protein PilN
MQRINLFSADLLPKRDALDFRRALWLLPAVFALLIIVALWQRAALHQERQRTDSARADVQAVLDQISAMSRQLPASAPAVSIEQLRQQLTERQAVLAALTSEHSASQGFSAFLMRLAEHADPAIWLTAITLDHAQVQLQGATVKPENLPDWLLSLQHGDGDKTLRFGQLQLQRVDDKPVLQFEVNGQWQ